MLDAAPWMLPPPASKVSSSRCALRAAASLASRVDQWEGVRSSMDARRVISVRAALSLPSRLIESLLAGINCHARAAIAGADRALRQSQAVFSCQKELLCMLMRRQMAGIKRRALADHHL